MSTSNNGGNGGSGKGNASPFNHSGGSEVKEEKLEKSPSLNSANQSFGRQSVMGNLNNWINDLSSGALFQGLSFLNFRRRGSRGSSTGSTSSSTLSPFFSRSASYSASGTTRSPLLSSTTADPTSTTLKQDIAPLMGWSSESDVDGFVGRTPAQFLNGTLIPTLKTKEIIELDNFGVVEVENLELGVGHKFELYELKAPTWCDSCSQFIWTPVVYDSKNTSIRILSPFSKTIQCTNCKYTCHIRCRSLVRIDCKGNAESTSTDISTASSPSDESKSNICDDLKSDTSEQLTRSETESKDNENSDEPDDDGGADDDDGDGKEDKSAKSADATGDNKIEESQSPPFEMKSTEEPEKKEEKEEETKEKEKSPQETQQVETPEELINEDARQLATQELARKIFEYNERLKRLGSGLGLTMQGNGSFRGFLRVHLNLTRPINVVAGTRPPSIYDIINEEEQTCRRTLTSFYMPRNTVKNIHITREYTSLDVIKAMLKKFKVVDNPQKFALYRRYPDEVGELTLTRIADNDYPLQIALDWCDWQERQVVLQENDTADIIWDAFLPPELNNFLIMLDREEQEHLNQLRLKYDCLRSELTRFIQLKEIEEQGILV